MIPTQDLIDTIAVAMAGDVGFLAEAGANLLHLVGAPFTPNPNLVLSDLSLLSAGDLAGLDPIGVTTGAQTVVADSTTGRRGIYLKEPLGGFRWVAGADPTSPIIVYGVALTDTIGTILFASANFSQPLQFAAELDVIEVSAEFGWFDWQPVQGPIIEATGPVAPPPP